MDFSKFSTKDLEYLKAQKIDKVSTALAVMLVRKLQGISIQISWRQNV